jgi:hypothetical protein
MQQAFLLSHRNSLVTTGLAWAIRGGGRAIFEKGSVTDIKLKWCSTDLLKGSYWENKNLRGRLGFVRGSTTAVALPRTRAAILNICEISPKALVMKVKVLGWSGTQFHVKRNGYKSWYVCILVTYREHPLINTESNVRQLMKTADLKRLTWN